MAGHWKTEYTFGSYFLLGVMLPVGELMIGYYLFGNHERNTLRYIILNNTYGSIVAYCYLLD